MLLPLIAGVLFTCLLGQTTAAQGLPKTFRNTRTQFRKDILEAALTEKRKQLPELQELEAKAAKGTDYTSAIRLRDRRLLLEKEITQMEQELQLILERATAAAQPPAPARVEFLAKDAQLEGVTLDSSDGAISGWVSAPASASWTLPDLPPGGYEVLLSYRADEGSVLLQESYYHLKAELSPAAKTAQSNLGTLRIRDGKSRLVLSVDPAKKNTNLRVYSLVLLPASH